MGEEDMRKTPEELSDIGVTDERSEEDLERQLRHATSGTRAVDAIHELALSGALTELRRVRDFLDSGMDCMVDGYSRAARKDGGDKCNG